MKNVSLQFALYIKPPESFGTATDPQARSLLWTHVASRPGHFKDRGISGEGKGTVDPPLFVNTFPRP